jgi:HK97 gp10 family phage protein
MAAGDKFADKLGSGADAVVADIAKAMYAAANVIQVEAQLSITNGSVSGRYHVPSNPGEPPKNDTGVLADNIETIQTEPLRAEVNSNAPYSSHLEYGTSRIAPRPFMRPAVMRGLPESKQILTDAVQAAVRKHFGK